MSTDIYKTLAKGDRAKTRSCECIITDDLGLCTCGKSYGCKVSDVCKRVCTDRADVSGKNYVREFSTLEYTLTGCCGSTTECKSILTANERNALEVRLVERTLTDACNTCGNGYILNVSFCKGVCTDRGDSCGNGETCEVALVERIVTDAYGGSGESYTCEFLTVVECVCTDNECLAVCRIETYACKILYAAERLSTDLGNVLTDNNRGDLGVVLKYGCTDLGDVIPRKFGKIAVKVLRVEEDFAKTLSVKYTVKGLECVTVLSNDYLGKRGTACKYGVCKGSNRCGDVNGCEVSTARECG